VAARLKSDCTTVCEGWDASGLRLTALDPLRCQVAEIAVDLRAKQISVDMIIPDLPHSIRRSHHTVVSEFECIVITTRFVTESTTLLYDDRESSTLEKSHKGVHSTMKFLVTLEKSIQL